jgi:CoA:oxalate CoA-transferase
MLTKHWGVAAMSDHGPLAGVTVVEAATYMSGPYAGQQLADLGATVTKVESPAGDPFRWFGRPATYVSAQWASMNRGKRSVVLDLRSDEGLRRMRQLLEGADVFLVNWRPGVAASLGLGDEALAAANPSLIRVYITGFGPDGPSASEPAFDTAVQARSGLMDALSSGGVPVVLPGYPLDKMTAVHATQAVLAALYQRERLGHGDRVDLAMLDVAASSDFPDLFVNRVFLDHQPDDPHNQHTAGIRPLPALDGWLVIAPATSRQIRAACNAVGRPEWADEILGADDQASLVRLLFERLASVTGEGTTDHWLQQFRHHDVAAAPCTSMDAHLHDPQVMYNGLYRTADWADAGRARYVRYPAVFAHWGPLAADSPPPRLGEHTDDVG